MDPVDIRFLMLLAQQEVQNYIRRSKNESGNVAQFQVSYKEQALYPNTTREEWVQDLFVTELSSYETQGDVLAELPDEWKMEKTSDFRAVVEVAFMINAEEYSFAFSAGFQNGITTE